MSERENERENERESENEGEREGQRDELGLDERQQRAFEELRRENAARRREARAAQQANDELRTELERIRVENESEQERATREAVGVAVAEVEERYGRRLLEAEVARRAAGRLHDPDDATRHVALDELLAVEDERELVRRIDAALDELLEAKPYLAADGDSSTSTTRRDSLVTQGPRSTPPRERREGVDADSWIRKRARRG